MDKVIETKSQMIWHIAELSEANERLEKENTRLKNGLKHYKRSLYKITSIANECTNSKMWDFKGV